MLGPNKKQQSTPTQTDSEWEQEKPIWDACEHGEISDDDAVTLDEFKALIVEIIEDEEITSDQND